MSSTVAAETITVFCHLYSMYRLPVQVVTDNGAQLIAEDFTKANEVKHFCQHHPSTNDLVERLIQTFKAVTSL